MTCAARWFVGSEVQCSEVQRGGSGGMMDVRGRGNDRSFNRNMTMCFRQGDALKEDGKELHVTGRPDDVRC